MAISKNAVAGGITALGGTGAVAGVVIANQNKGTTIKEELVSYLIEIENESGFADRWAQKGSDTVPEGVGEGTNQKKLKDWCKKQYEIVITDEVRKENGLLDQVKKWCTFTIKQRLGNEALNVEATIGNNENPDKSDWEIKTKNLKDYEDLETNKSFDIEDIKITKQSIEKKTESDSNSWQELKKWCEEAYKLNHLENTSNKLEIAKKFCTKATILDALNGNELPEEGIENVWTEKSGKASSTEDNEGKTKDSDFFTELTKANADKNKELKTWCRKQYSKHHKDTIKNQNSITILSEVQKLCVELIKDKLEASKKFSSFDNEDEKWTTNETTLKSFTDSSSGPKLTKRLKEIKGTGVEDANRKNKLKAWCKEAYDKGYKGEQDNLLLLVKKFCTKNTEVAA